MKLSRKTLRSSLFLASLQKARLKAKFGSTSVILTNIAYHPSLVWWISAMDWIVPNVNSSWTERRKLEVLVVAANRSLSKSQHFYDSGRVFSSTRDLLPITFVRVKKRNLFPFHLYWYSRCTDAGKLREMNNGDGVLPRKKWWARFFHYFLSLRRWSTFFFLERWRANVERENLYIHAFGDLPPSAPHSISAFFSFLPTLIFFAYDICCRGEMRNSWNVENRTIRRGSCRHER